MNDVYQMGYADCHIELLEDFQAKAYVIVPLMIGTRLWGLLAAYRNATPHCWDSEEVELLEQMAGQLGMALKQSEALDYQKQQAAALKKATERQQSLSRTIDKIRQSLDIDTIFKTTTQEVRQLLEVDRVAIYRFNSDWSETFVADSIVDGWDAQLIMPGKPVIEEVFSKPDEAGKYPRNEVFVPISQGDKLWGLLMAYQTSSPRYWSDDEMALLAKVGSQLGIALKQAELLKTTQQQTQQLNMTLGKLQQTQARLIQGEKMAGLGQLVAGLAHEINNPVSFVYSNVEPAQEYVSDLLSLLKLYQTQFPSPGESIAQQAEAMDIDFVMEDLPKLIDSMRMGAARIQDIVQSMRIFSRMDESNCKEVDVHTGLDSTLMILGHRLKAQAQRPAVEVVKDYGELPPVNCHPGQLNQVFMNVLTNALDAIDDVRESDRPMQIRIVTDWIEAHDRVVIQIEDTGTGIPEEVMPHIFNPFFTTKPVGKGTGLGLSISYQIMTEIHQGKLDCLSRCGEGTTFRIELPMMATCEIDSFTDR